MSRFSPQYAVQDRSGEIIANAISDALSGINQRRQMHRLEAKQDAATQRQNAIQDAQLGEQGIHLTKPGELPPMFDVNVSGGPNVDGIVSRAITPLVAQQPRRPGAQPFDEGGPIHAAVSRHLDIGPGYYVDRDQQAETAKRAAESQFQSILFQALAKGKAEDIVNPGGRALARALTQSEIDKNNRPPTPPPPRAQDHIVDPVTGEVKFFDPTSPPSDLRITPTPKASGGKAGADAGQPSESERRAGALYQVGEDAFKTLSTSTPPSRLQNLAARLGVNEAVDQNRQLINQAARQFATAYLYVVSGATASPQEVENIAQQVQDQPGDKPETTARKAQARQVMMDAIRTVAGRAAPTGVAPATGIPGNVDLRGDTAGKTITVNGKTFKVPE